MICVNKLPETSFPANSISILNAFPPHLSNFNDRTARFAQDMIGAITPFQQIKFALAEGFYRNQLDV